MHTPFRTILGVLACALLGGASKAGQASEISAAMIKLERDDPRVMEHLEYLTERIGHRLTGSPNNMQACEWAAQRFRSFGLEARVEQWGSFPVGFDRGPSSGGMLSPVKFDYVFTTNAWTAGTPGPMRGAALLMPRDAAEVEQLGEGLRGAWVVDRSKQDQTQAAEQHKQVLALLREAGIAGRVTNANSSGSARTKDYVYAFGNYRVDPENLPTEVKVNLLQVMYDDLVARLERGEDVLLEFDIDNRFLPGPFPVQNVIAELKGSELPDEYVIIGGHIDSWEPADGAQDNGTGIATTLEAARLLMEVGA